MSPENSQLYQRIQAFSLDNSEEPLSFSKRLAEENQWSLSYTKRVIEEYKKFTFLAVVAGHAVSPSVSIDKAWHLHLTYTRSYWEEFCPHILQTSLHHEPSGGSLTEEVKFKGLYEQTLKSYETFFGEIPPSDIWTSTMIASEQNQLKKIVSIFNTKIIQIVLVTLIIWILLGINWISDAPVYLNSRLFTDHNSALAIPLYQYNYYWDFVNVNIEAKADGRLMVEEVQKYTFNAPVSNERYRFILLDKLDEIRNVSVKENGQLLNSKTNIENQRFNITWSHPLNAPESHTFTINYEVLGGLHRQLKLEKDELYWKAIFPTRRYPILNAKITLKLPPELEGKIIDLESVGYPTIKKQIDSQTIEFVALNTIPPQQEIVIKGTFPHDILDLPLAKKQFSQPLSQEVFVFLILILIGVLLVFIVVLSSNHSHSSSISSSSGCSSGSSCGGGCGSSCGGGG